MEWIRTVLHIYKLKKIKFIHKYRKYFQKYKMSDDDRDIDIESDVSMA